MAGPGPGQAAPITISPAKPPVPLAKRLRFALFVAVAFAPALAIVATHLDYFEQVIGRTAGGIEAPRAGSLGDARLATLVGISEDYDGPDAARLHAAGDLAPSDYLNTILAERRIKWRVRKVDGPYAELYEVS